MVILFVLSLLVLLTCVCIRVWEKGNQKLNSPVLRAHVREGRRDDMRLANEPVKHRAIQMNFTWRKMTMGRFIFCFTRPVRVLCRGLTIGSYKWAQTVSFDFTLQMIYSYSARWNFWIIVYAQLNLATLISPTCLAAGFTVIIYQNIFQPKARVS